MYYTELDPRTMKPLYVPKTLREKAMQRALLQWKRPQNKNRVLEALRQAGREDLIGFGRHCLVRPYQPARKHPANKAGSRQGEKIPTKKRKKK